MKFIGFIRLAMSSGLSSWSMASIRMTSSSLPFKKYSLKAS